MSHDKFNKIVDVANIFRKNSNSFRIAEGSGITLTNNEIKDIMKVFRK